MSNNSHNNISSYSFSEANAATIENAVVNAHAVFNEYKKKPSSQKILFLQNIASEILSIKSELIPITQRETFLPPERLEGELQRTIKQINLFKELLQEGSWVRAVIDIKDQPPSDIRRMQIPIGVVGVFGASNFPYAFSVAGGDTIAALAAGCPVVYKSNPGHPQTSDLVAGCIVNAAKKSGIPENFFSILHGASHEVGLQLVMHPLISAIAFTGSFRGGKALYDAAAKRKNPIPVYAEMGSINPIFILPEMLEQNYADIAAKIINSNLLGTGQFCTNPGLIILPPSAASKNFIDSSSEKIRNSEGAIMLTENIYQSYISGTKKMAANKNVKLLALGMKQQENQKAIPHLFLTEANNFLQDEALLEEVFGPSSLFVRTFDGKDLYNIANHLPGQLTITVWGTENDLKDHAKLIGLLEDKAGRLVINGVPTGVEVTAAMVHGGPFPATTDSKTTSVGTDAIYRFTRPVCYQGFPEYLLHNALKNDNPMGIWRLINSRLSKEPITNN